MTDLLADTARRLYAVRKLIRAGADLEAIELIVIDAQMAVSEAMEAGADVTCPEPHA